MTHSVGPFTLQEFAGRGGQGEVWRARDDRSGLRIAVKRLAPGGASLLPEIRSAARVDHPGLARVLDYGRTGDGEAWPTGTPWLALEWAERGTLKPHCGRVDWAAISAWLEAVLETLAWVHACGLIHRDVKPSNILLDAAGRTKLTDFGLAAAGAKLADRAGSGTPAYMAPEQWTASWREHGPPTDLYAVGGTAWALLTGSPPFGDDDADRLRDAHTSWPLPTFDPRTHVPVGVEPWLRSMLSRDPGRRPACAADALAGLRSLSMNPAKGTPAVAAMHGVRPALPTPMDVPIIRVTDRLSSLRTPPLFGREDELDALWGELVQCTESSKPRFTRVTGQAGAGRTALARGFGRLCESAGAAWTVYVNGRHPTPLLDASLRLLGATGLRGHQAGQVARAAAIRLEASGADDAQRLAVARDEDLAAGVLANLIEALGVRRPVVVVMDDTNASVNGAMAGLIADIDRAVLTIVTAKRERDGDIVVGPLTDHLNIALETAAGLLPSASSRLAAHVAFLPGPGFELLHRLIHTGRLVETRGGLALPGVLPDAPDSVDQPELVLAALFGPAFALEPLRAAATHAGLDLDVDGLLRAGVWFERDGEIHWSDPALRKLAATDSRAAQYATVAADFAPADQRPMLLWRAGRLEAARPLLAEAAYEAGWNDNPTRELVEAWLNTDPPAPDSRIDICLATMAMMDGDREACARLLTDIVERDDHPDCFAVACMLRGMQCQQRNEDIETLEHCDRALIRTDLRSRSRAVVLGTASLSAAILGDRERAQADGAESIALRKKSGSVRDVVHGFLDIAKSAKVLGDLPAVRRALDDATDYARQMGQVSKLASLRMLEASYATQTGDYEVAERLYRRAILIRRVNGNHASMWPLNALAFTCMMMGEHQEALELARRSLRVSKEAGFSTRTDTAAILRAVAAAELQLWGEVDEALDAVSDGGRAFPDDRGPITVQRGREACARDGRVALERRFAELAIGR